MVTRGWAVATEAKVNNTRRVRSFPAKAQRRKGKPGIALQIICALLCLFVAVLLQFRSSPNLTHPTLMGMLNGALKNRNSALRRGIGLLLLVLIVYGTTVEAAHRHGRVRSVDSSSATLIDSEHTSTPVNSTNGCSDCLICQLHQSFTTTLIVFRLLDPPSQIRLQITTQVPRDVLSQMASPVAGRAPPFIS